MFWILVLIVVLAIEEVTRRNFMSDKRQNHINRVRRRAHFRRKSREANAADPNAPGAPVLPVLPAASGPGEKQWYYQDGAQARGPVSESQLVQMFAAGSLSRATLVWSSDMAGWAPAESVAALTKVGARS